MKNRNCLTMSVSSCLAVDKSDSNRLTSCSVLEEILNFYILIHTQYTRIYIYIYIYTNLRTDNHTLLYL